MRLQGKTVVITGAAAGIGRSIAETFASEGATLILSDIDKTRLESVAADINSDDIITLVGNIADKDHAESLILTAVEQFGKLDVLVNNAGIIDKYQGVAEVSDDTWERVIAVNLNGSMYTCRKAVAVMSEQPTGGSIVNIASAAGVRGACGGAAYTASKHGVVGLTRNTAWIYAQKNIRCNAILPGGTNTELVTKYDPSQLGSLELERLGASMNIMPGLMEPADIAKVALFLASDDSSKINGATISADMGWLA